MAQPVRRPRRRRSAADTGVKRRWLWLLVPLLFPAAALISFYATNAAELTISDLLPTFGQYFLGVVAVTAIVPAAVQPGADMVMVAVPVPTAVAVKYA